MKRSTLQRTPTRAPHAIGWPDWACSAHKNAPWSGPGGVLCKKSGDTYSRTFGTTIGSESLTTVFGMGTGVTFQIWSPEKTPRAAVKPHGG